MSNYVWADSRNNQSEQWGEPIDSQKNAVLDILVVSPLPLSTLSKALSVNIGDTTLDRDAINDTEAILQWCGSLVRQSPGADTLELANYTVKEFLESIDLLKCPQISEYRVDVSKDAVKLTVTCLTYLNFDNFDVQDTKDLRLVTKRMEEYKFLQYCVRHWDNHIRVVENDNSVLQLLQIFIIPTRTNQCLAWISSVVAISAVNVRSERAHGEQTTKLDYNTLD